MREAILSWEKELAEGCTYYNFVGAAFTVFFADPVKVRRAALIGMLGYGKLYNGDVEGAREMFRESLELDPSNAKIAFELWLLDA